MNTESTVSTFRYKDYSWDEAGMADLFSECYDHDTRYCPEAKSWYTYDGGKWQKDVGSLLVSNKIKEFVRIMALYCGEIPDEDKRKQYMAFVGKMGDRRFRDRLMKDAADNLKIAAAEFDTHPFLINCKNGTYDLESLTFREHKWDDFLTMQTNFEYGVKKEKCARWEQFIKEVTQNDKDKADYLQRALGYSILGTSKVRVLHGSGSTVVQRTPPAPTLSKGAESLCPLQGRTYAGWQGQSGYGYILAEEL